MGSSIGSGKVIQEYPYNIRYLDQQGNLLTKQQYDDKLPNKLFILLLMLVVLIIVVK